MLNGASGNEVYAEPTSEAKAFASLHDANPSDSGPINAYSAGTSRHSTAVFAGFVATVKPSIATSNSTQLIPASAHNSASESLIGREASEISDSPEQNFLKPSPVPGPSTATANAPPDNSSASSATRTEIGSTVEEPDTNTLPAGREELDEPESDDPESDEPESAAGAAGSSAVESSSPPQAAITSDAAAAKATNRLE